MDDVDSFLECLSEALGENFDDEACGDADVASHRKIPSAIRVERIPYSSVTAEEFARNFSSRNKPIILGDAACVPMHLNLAYWAATHSGDLVPLDVSTPDERVVKLGDFCKFDNADLNKGYLRSLHTFEWFPQENGELVFPEVFGQNYLAEGHLREAGVLPVAWKRWFELFISTRESWGFPFLHQDMCSTHAFSMQVQGIKRFYMFPPSDSEYLYTFGHTGTRSSIPHIDMVEDKVDMEKYPLYKKATMYIADLRAGDVFFCPSDWWHSTKVISAEPSVTLGGNFVDSSNLGKFEASWKNYTDLQKMVAAGVVSIEHGGKRPKQQTSSPHSPRDSAPTES